MKYSVIIPFYNSAIWLERCVQSVLQDGNFEFIFINDRSTDGGEKIIECYSDPRIKLIDNEHAKGVSGARNTGIEHATGEWVTFLDADDEMLQGAYETFESVPKTANIIQLQHLRHYIVGNTVVNKYPHEAGAYDFEELPPMWYMVWNKLYRASFLKDIRFVEGVQYGEDEVFNLDCLVKDNHIECVEQVMTLRHFDNYHSLSKSKGREGLIKQARALEDFLLRCDDPVARLAVCKILSENWDSNVYKREFA